MIPKISFVLVLALSAPRSWAADAELPDGFLEEKIAEGITGAVAMAIAPDGRLFVCEQTGALRIVRNGELLARPFLQLDVDSHWERGLIGVALDPRFPRQPYVYVHYIPAQPYPHHRISRFTARGDVALVGSEKILFEGDDQRKVLSPVPWGHQGGQLHFGLDGTLFFGIGDHRTGAPSQSLDSLLGKMLRINANGTIPRGNPFYSKTKGNLRAIWALGLRNPFDFAIHPTTGKMLINDVGESTWEEIDEGVAGANYGWPTSEGDSNDPTFRAPIHVYGRGVGRSLAGGIFYTGKQFPEAYRNKYFFVDFEDHWIHTLDPDDPKVALPFAKNLKRPVALAVGGDGALYILQRNAWVKDDAFKGSTGFITRVRHVPGVVSNARKMASVPITLRGGVKLPVRTTPDALPKLLSRTGIFSSLQTLTPATGVVPYEINVPLWSDGASKRRFMALPEGGRISFTPRGEWTFPTGTLFIKHFELGKRLETRLLIVDGSGGGYGVTYRWRADGSDADLLEDAALEELGKQTWAYPSRQDCLACHTVNAGFVLGVKTRQINRLTEGDAARINQLSRWSEQEMFASPLKQAELSTYDKLLALDDTNASLDRRVRSYLDANCAGCHRPSGTPSRVDMRYDAAPELQNIINGPLSGVNLDIPESLIVVPGSPEKSSLYLRMKRRHDVFKMPPLASRIPDPAALMAVEEWIRSLKE